MNCRQNDRCQWIDEFIPLAKQIHRCYVRAIMLLLYSNILLHAGGLTIDVAADETRNLFQLFCPAQRRSCHTYYAEKMITTENAANVNVYKNAYTKYVEGHNNCSTIF